MSAYDVEVAAPGAAPKLIRIDAETEAGREAALPIDDDQISRRHLMLTPHTDGVLVTDLDSTNGTWVGGRRLTAPELIRPGEMVRAGRTTIRVLGPASRAQRPDPNVMAVTATAAGDVRYQPGTAGEPAAAVVAKALPAARQQLVGLGDEAGKQITVLLVDPYPDPDFAGGQARGTSIVADRGEIWMVVTSSDPPEALQRPLALLFGAGLPEGARVRRLCEGWGLHLAAAPDADDALARRGELPPLDAAPGQLGAAMAVSFVRYLIGIAGDDVLLAALRAPAGGLDDALRAAYGAELAELENRWKKSLSGLLTPADVAARLAALAERDPQQYQSVLAEITRLLG